jgi:adenine-specific DNA methylase
MTAVVTVKPGQTGKKYRPAFDADMQAFQQAAKALKEHVQKYGPNSVPQEPLPPVGTLGLRVNNYGLTKWGDLFNTRQALALITFGGFIRQTSQQPKMSTHPDYTKAVCTFLACVHDRLADKAGSICVWNTVGEKLEHVFGRQALPMVWDYGEVNPFSGLMGDWTSGLEWARLSLLSGGCLSQAATCYRGTATAVPMEERYLDAVLTDPPYYDAVPYADLSDFFYVWLKQSVGPLHPDVLRAPLTPKRQELVRHLDNRALGDRLATAGYEAGMAQAFAEMRRVLGDDGVCAVMFAHKTTTAWESIITGLISSGWIVTASWPLHTERPGRLRAQCSAALASSVTLICRKRATGAAHGLWDDVRHELRQMARERLDFFWSQHVRGADFFISAIGPALSVFGKYERVTKLTGEEVTVARFLDEVRAIVTSYALAKVLKAPHTASIDPESRFYVVWKWSYGDAKVPADESFKLAQALGMNTEVMWDRVGVLEKSGENVQAVPVAKRMKIKGLGEPGANGAPASLIDVLHRMCVFREKGDTEGMAEFLARSGQAQGPGLWLVAQAVSEVLLDGDEEKQLMQGLLNQRGQLAEAQGGLF